MKRGGACGCRRPWPGRPGGTPEGVRAILQGSSARKTAQCAVFSENGKASAFPRTYFQVYFLNARSAVRNKYILKLAEAKPEPLPPSPG